MPTGIWSTMKVRSTTSRPSTATSTNTSRTEHESPARAVRNCFSDGTFAGLYDDATALQGERGAAPVAPEVHNLEAGDSEHALDLRAGVGAHRHCVCSGNAVAQERPVRDDPPGARIPAAALQQIAVGQRSPVRGQKMPRYAVAVLHVQQQQPVGSEDAGKLLQRRLVFRIVVEVAERGKEVDDRLKRARLQGQTPDVAAHKARRQVHRKACYACNRMPQIGRRVVQTHYHEPVS